MNETTDAKTCTKCGETKPVDEFHRDSKRADGRFRWCKTCERERRRRYWEANPGKRREKRRRWREAHPEERRRQREANPEKEAERGRRYREANREKIREKNRRYREANREKRREQERSRVVNRDRERQRRAELRAAIFAHYGEVCACCGTTDRLSIDHVNGLDGGPGTTDGYRLYCWLRRTGFPDGYQTLCRPCNASKQTGDRCRLRHAGNGLTSSAAS
jgi:hypothetical protein